MKAHMIRVASGGSKSWGVRLEMNDRLLADEFIRVREEGPTFHRAGRTPDRPGAPWPFWWAGTEEPKVHE